MDRAGNKHVREDRLATYFLEWREIGKRPGQRPGEVIWAHRRNRAELIGETLDKGNAQAAK
jgi:hypothetical protein